MSVRRGSRYECTEPRESQAVIRDVRREPISFASYSIGDRRGRDLKWHASVRIHPDESRWLKQFMVQFSRNATTEEVEEEFARLRFEPYAPVVRQLFSVLRMVNRTRQSLGLESVPVEAVRTRRRVLSPFESVPASTAAAAVIPTARRQWLDC